MKNKLVINSSENMLIQYNGFPICEIEIPEENKADFIDILHMELIDLYESCKKEYPNSTKGFTVYFTQEETLSLFQKRIALRSERFIINKGKKINYTLITHYALYPSKAFYDGDLWMQKIL